MTGYNMPPGCNVSDIPGNRPEDLKAEAFFDVFYEFEEKTRKQHPTMDDAYVEAMSLWLWDQIGKVYQEGYREGVADASMEKKDENV